MTALEKTTLADGFRVALLECWENRGAGAILFRARLYDGGREADSVRYAGRRARVPAEAAAGLARILARVAAPPYVLAACGRGWKQLLAMTRPDIIPNLRILDLFATAAALEPALPARPSFDALLQAYGLSHEVDESALSPAAVEALLWAVVARAGRLGLDWPALLDAATGARRRADFSRYAFAEAALAALPPSPGIYVMRDGAGAALYVGKSANLARRLGEYFRDETALPAKTEEIRRRIHSFEIHRAGSELEALLLENRLITVLRPAINIQREIEETRTARALPAPVAVVERSEAAGCAELFLFGGRDRAVQVRLRLGKPAEASLRHVVAFARGREKLLRRTRCITDWGRTGNEICLRHFAAARERLHWVEAGPATEQPDGRRRLVEIARRVLAADLPGEYRWGE